MEGEGREKEVTSGGREREREGEGWRTKNGDRGGWDGPRGVGGEG